MDVIVNNICGKYQEVEVTEIHSGTLDDREATELAVTFLRAAEDLLVGAGEQDYSGSISDITDKVEEANYAN